MSANLLPFVMGHHKLTEKTSLDDDRKVRLYIVDGKERERPSLLNVTPAASYWLELYVDMRYPFDKLEDLGIRNFGIAGSRNSFRLYCSMEQFYLMTASTPSDGTLMKEAFDAKIYIAP